MSSWLSRFKSDGDQTRPDSPNPYSSSAGGGGGGRVIKDALSHHLRGVANFLAPPPPPLQENTTTTTTTSITTSSSSQAISGIKNDLAEIEESFKSSLSLLSTKLASSFLKFTNNNNKDEDNEEEEYDDYEDINGINEEVMDFVRELSSRPKFWTDFPINLPNEFEMSDYQREHAAAIGHLVPSLLTLRQKICSHLSDGQFWMIYFTILLPRLSEDDLNYLSTPEIVAVRETLLQKLQKERNTVVETADHSDAVISSEKDVDLDSKQRDESSSQQNISAETLHDPQEVETGDNQKPDQWLEDEDPDPSTFLDARRQPQNEEEVSFSDLEDEEKDLSGSLSGFRLRQKHMIASFGESNDWTQLNENSGGQAIRLKARQSGLQEKDSEGEDSNDWHHVNDVDLESSASS